MKKRRLLFSSFDQLYAEVDVLQSHGYLALGQWSLSQMCDHLRNFMDCSMHGFGGATIGWPLRLMGKPALYFTLWTNWIPSGYKAPDQFLPKVPPADDPATIDAFRATASALENFTGEFQLSPLFGRLTGEQWRRVHLIHAAHHLNFLVPKSS